MKDPKSVYINAQQLRCMFCESLTFVEKDTRLNESWAFFWGELFEYFTKKTKTYVCANCGFVHEFSVKKKQ